jgi:hypothetical protein
VLEERAPVPESPEVIGDRLAASVGEALHLPERLSIDTFDAAR